MKRLRRYIISKQTIELPESDRTEMGILASAPRRDHKWVLGRFSRDADPNLKIPVRKLGRGRGEDPSLCPNLAVISARNLSRILQVQVGGGDCIERKTVFSRLL